MPFSHSDNLIYRVFCLKPILYYGPIGGASHTNFKELRELIEIKGKGR